MPDAATASRPCCTDERVAWYRSPIDKATLNALMQRSNARGQVHGEWNHHVLPASDTALRRRHRDWARTLLVGLNANTRDFRMNTRTFTCSWLPAFHCWNMQYHLEHHMFPAVPFHQLPKLRAAIAHDLPPAPHGLRATGREMLEIRERMRADPAYRHVPAVPQATGAASSTTTSTAPAGVPSTA